MFVMCACHFHKSRTFELMIQNDSAGYWSGFLYILWERAVHSGDGWAHICACCVLSTTNFKDIACKQEAIMRKWYGFLVAGWCVSVCFGMFAMLANCAEQSRHCAEYGRMPYHIYNILCTCAWQASGREFSQPRLRVYTWQIVCILIFVHANHLWMWDCILHVCKYMVYAPLES